MPRGWIATAVLCALAIGYAYGAPTDTDLHASYCLRMLRRERNFTGQMILTMRANHPSASSPAGIVLASVQRNFDQLQAAVQQVKNYFIPRLLGPAGATLDDMLQIQNASNAAEADWQRIQATANTCGARAPVLCQGKTNAECAAAMQECSVRADPGMPAIQAKVNACVNPTWLPY